MSSPEKNVIVNFNCLKKDFDMERPVVLFVGTGINYYENDVSKNDVSKKDVSKKDVSWNALLNHLLKHSIRMILPNNKQSDKIRKSFIGEGKQNKDLDELFPRMVKTTIVKQTLKNTSYVNLIQDFLYRQCPKEDLTKACSQYVTSKGDKCDYYTLFRLADMILRCPNIKAVVTQNYDDFLEDAIDLLSKYYEQEKILQNLRKPRTVCDWKMEGDFSANSINIYHVHGFIPRYNKIQAPKNNNIVLSLDEFYEDSRNVFSWQISSQLHFLFQYTCVFCGLSLDDYTSQRLLHYVKGKHKGNLYYITASEKKVKNTTLFELKNRFHTENGLTVLYCKQGFHKIYESIGELAQIKIDTSNGEKNIGESNNGTKK